MIHYLHTIKKEFIELYKQQFFYNTWDTELREVNKIFNLLIDQYETSNTNSNNYNTNNNSI